jgi:hypothetical protein
MREQQAQKSRDEIESKNRLFDDGIVILAWQNCPPRAVPPASDASHVRCLPVRQFLPQLSTPKHVQLTV